MMGRNQLNTRDLRWLRDCLDALPQPELPPSLSAEALFARMDQLDAQGPGSADGVVLAPDFGAGSRRRTWQRLAPAAAVFLVVAVAAYQQGMFGPRDGMSGAAPKAASSVAPQEESPDLAMDAAPFAMRSQAAPGEWQEPPAVESNMDTSEVPQPGENPPTGGGMEEDQKDGGGMFHGLQKAALSAGELYRQADLVVTAALPGLETQDTVTVQPDRVLKGETDGLLTLYLGDKTSLDSERVYVLFLVWEGDGCRLLQDPPLLYLSPQEVIQDQEGRSYGTVQAPAF